MLIKLAFMKLLKINVFKIRPASQVEEIKIVIKQVGTYWGENLPRYTLRSGNLLIVTLPWE